MKEAANEVGKVRDIEMDTETFNRERKISNCTTGQRSDITEKLKLSWRLTGVLCENHLTINITIDCTSIIIILILEIVGRQIWWQVRWSKLPIKHTTGLKVNSCSS
jgi:hypothetical protein